MPDFSEPFETALLALDRVAARRIVDEALNHLTPLEFVNRVVVEALARIGESWERGTTALAQIYMSGRICEELVDRLLPPGDPRRKDQPPMAIAALDDYHLLGKRIVYSILRAEGYELKDYGRVSAEEAVGRVSADGIQVLLVSTLMLNSALRVRDLVDGLKKARQGTKVIVGGAPFRFDPELWREVQADAMGYSASDVTDIVRIVMGGGA